MLLVSRYTKLLPYYKTKFEAAGFSNIHVTDKEKDALNFVINDVNPRFLVIDSHFYNAATPLMIGILLKSFPKLHIAVISTAQYPDELAAFFIFYGAEYYINFLDGIEEFKRGLGCIREGKGYIAPDVQRIIDDYPEWPDLKMRTDKRQLEVLIMLCNGNTPDDIGSSLHITRRTVDWHIEELKYYFNVNTREQLISVAFYLEIVTKKDLCFFKRKKRNEKGKGKKKKDVSLIEFYRNMHKNNEQLAISNGES
jgi:DNA-binding NarL/FixJ family response regulator